MDLNLVRVFVAIFETRSLTLAGERLYVTQSAVSQSLGRLRAELDDPLFERAGREMRPTAVADGLFASFRDALMAIDRAVDAVHGFDAAASDRVFRIALSELGEIGWLANLFDAIHAVAPRVRIEVVPLDVERLEEWLQRGTVDLAVTPADLPGEFERLIVKDQAYVAAMSSAHPLATLDLTPERFLGADHVVVAGDSGLPLVEAAMRRAGLTLEPLVRVQHFATLPHLLVDTPRLIATVPASIAQGWAATLPLTLHKLPFPLAPVALRLYQRRTSQHAGALAWFATTVAQAIAGTTGEFDSIRAGGAPGVW
ncbi:LysR family transcriptional regulator [Pseudoclavibacter endophyticus]|uniref:LysR family transcriptional regulator n=1 Tax=Pseudoclavibacter endophyticus TaxID=1778590 RepID=UPI00166C10DF|nr:LysR family transcriptional regulator [Pseudoclavibacter endophyticus]